MLIDELYEIPPFSLAKQEKRDLFADKLCKLCALHAQNCPEYAKVLNSFQYDLSQKKDLEYVPYMPIRLFKLFELKSVAAEDVMKTMTSSGTSGQSVSKIFLDKQNIQSQTKTLTYIIQSFIGKQRIPLLLLDTEIVKKDRAMFSARGAGIIGFTPFGRNTTYALNEDMSPNFERIKDFFEKYGNGPVLMFGYTYMIWQHIIKEFAKHNMTLPFHNAILFHIGGWKKLKAEAIETKAYNEKIRQCLGNVKIYNYYGMAEQLGSVFVECEEGHMHCSNFSDVLIRRPRDFSLCEHNEAGIIQLISLLPTSYPGHSILTEDEGIILGEDDCKCGRKGKYFKILGRLKNAELRGCSDTYEQ